MKRIGLKPVIRQNRGEDYYDVPYTIVVEDDEPEEDFFDRLKNVSPAAFIIPITISLVILMVLFDDPQKVMAWWVVIAFGGFSLMFFILLFSTIMIWLRETNRLFMALMGVKKYRNGKRR